MTARGKRPAGLLENGIGGSPADDGEFGILRPLADKGARVGVARNPLQLAHAFVHHLRPHRGVGVPIGNQHPLFVMFIRRGDVHPARRAGQRARGNAAGGVAVAPVFAVDGRSNFAAFDRHVRIEAFRIDDDGPFREVQVHHHNHRHLVFLGQVEGFDRGVVGVDRIERRQDRLREFPLRGSQRLEQVALLGFGRQPGRGAAALGEDRHHRRFDHPGHSDRLGHQRKTAAGGADHRPHPGVARADRHVDRGQFVLGLLHQHSVAGGARRQPVHDRGGRRHRVGRIEFAAARDRAEGRGLVPGDHDPALAVPRQAVPLRRRKMLLREFPSPAGDGHVGV